jgi:hypothetical protein
LALPEGVKGVASSADKMWSGEHRVLVANHGELLRDNGIQTLFYVRVV